MTNASEPNRLRVDARLICELAQQVAPLVARETGWELKLEEPSFSVLPRGLCPDRVVSLPSGRLMLVVPCGGEGLRLFASDDGGHSWQHLSEMRPNEEPRPAESTLVPLDETRMVCYSRDDGALGSKTISLDGGRTWNDRCMTCFAGRRPCGGLLESGHVLVTYRLPGGWTYAYLESRKSALEPEWKEQRGAVLRLDGAGANHFWDYGYSGWVQLPDSRIFGVYYTRPPVDGLPSFEPKPSIRGAWFSEGNFAAR
jgi:hypothetical protein